jgi:pimeloyl-ACP methyl ester carboxylesterase
VSDLKALRAVADWIKTFVVKPHKDLGRAGTVCPFVPGSLERKTLWLAPEQIADRDVPEVVELMSGYKRLLLDTRPTEGDDVIYNVIVVVFADLSADRAQGVFDDVLKQLAVPSYVQDGIVFGPFYEGNERTAIYNAGFRPFQSPVPFLFGRNRDLVPGARSSTRVMPVPNHPAASACTLKFSRVYSHRTIAGGVGHNLPQEAPEAFADAVLQAGGRGT